jgi:putative transposase
MDDIYKTYLHNPPHYFVSNAMYMVTGSTLYNKRYLSSNEHKSIVMDILLERADRWMWRLEAWAILENHYHFVGQAPENALTLTKLIQQFHSKTTVFLNRLDKESGRQVWHNYWDTCITHEASYNARLHYVHLNPVKHKLVEKAEDYPFCSYHWFLEKSNNDLRDAVMNQPINKVNIFDDFDL